MNLGSTHFEACLKTSSTPAFVVFLKT